MHRQGAAPVILGMHLGTCNLPPGTPVLHPSSIIFRWPFIHRHFYPIQDILGRGDIGTGRRLFDNGLEVFGDNAGLMEV